MDDAPAAGPGTAPPPQAVAIANAEGMLQGLASDDDDDWGDVGRLPTAVQGKADAEKDSVPSSPGLDAGTRGRGSSVDFDGDDWGMLLGFDDDDDDPAPATPGGKSDVLSDSVLQALQAEDDELGGFHDAGLAELSGVDVSAGVFDPVLPGAETVDAAHAPASALAGAHGSSMFVRSASSAAAPAPADTAAPAPAAEAPQVADTATGDADGSDSDSDSDSDDFEDWDAEIAAEEAAHADDGSAPAPGDGLCGTSASTTVKPRLSSSSQGVREVRSARVQVLRCVAPGLRVIGCGACFAQSLRQRWAQSANRDDSEQHTESLLEFLRRVASSTSTTGTAQPLAGAAALLYSESADAGPSVARCVPYLAGQPPCRCQPCANRVCFSCWPQHHRPDCWSSTVAPRLHRSVGRHAFTA